MTNEFADAQAGLPFPVAGALRAFLNARDAGEPTLEVLDAGLHVGENIVITCGALGLAWTAHQGEPDGAAQEWFESLRRGGLSLGRWWNAARSVSKRATAVGDPGLGLAGIFGNEERGFVGGVNTLIKLRNRRAHDGPIRSKTELQQRIEETHSAVERTISLAGFLAERPLVFAERSIRRYGRAEFENTGALLMGDHPEFSPWSAVSETALDVDAVYILDSGRYVLVTPFLQVSECPSCGNRELFAPDRAASSKSGAISMRSTISPHEFRAQHLLEDFARLACFDTAIGRNEPRLSASPAEQATAAGVITEASSVSETQDGSVTGGYGHPWSDEAPTVKVHRLDPSTLQVSVGAQPQNLWLVKVDGTNCFRLVDQTGADPRGGNASPLPMAELVRASVRSGVIPTQPRGTPATVVTSAQPPTLPPPASHRGVAQPPPPPPPPPPAPVAASAMRSNEVVTSPGDRLRDPSWRRRHSLWLLGPLALGLVTWASFLWVGMRAKRRSWLTAGVGYFTLIAGAIALEVSAPHKPNGHVDTSTWQANVSTAMFLLTWLGGFVHALLINREWLKFKAHRSDVRWYEALD